MKKSMFKFLGIFVVITLLIIVAAKSAPWVAGVIVLSFATFFLLLLGWLVATNKKGVSLNSFEKMSVHFFDRYVFKRKTTYENSTTAIERPEVGAEETENPKNFPVKMKQEVFPFTIDTNRGTGEFNNQEEWDLFCKKHPYGTLALLEADMYLLYSKKNRDVKNFTLYSTQAKTGQKLSDFVEQ